MSEDELLVELKRRAAAIGLEIDVKRIPRPQLKVVEGSKQEDNASAR
jgi:hypothetical protein